MKKIYLFVLLLPILCSAQMSYDSLPEYCGLSTLLVSGPFTCPGKEQQIKFPKEFYKEAGKKQILEIFDGRIKREVPCISSKKELSYYDKKENFCMWWFAMKYLPEQCDKWKRAGERGIKPSFKQVFYKKLMNTKTPYSFLIPDLSLHYFYFDKDTFPDLAVYDCTNGTGPSTTFMKVVKDSIELLPHIHGYAQDVRKVIDGLVIITRWEGELEGDYHAQGVYKITHGVKGVVVKDSLFLASRKGLKLPTYTTDKKFKTFYPCELVTAPGVLPQGGEPKFEKNSFGYILAEENGYCFVIMLNNLNDGKSTLRTEIESHLDKPVAKFYTIGWIPRDAIGK